MKICRVPTSAFVATLASCLLLLSGCSEDATSSLAGQRNQEASLSGRLILTGSSTVAPLINEIAKRFEGLHPGVRIDVQTGGSSRGINDTRQGLANIGMVSRSLTPKEDDLVAHPIARDGIAIITHRDNPVTALSDQQIADIFLGTINNWSTLGGPDAPITVVNKAEGRSTLELFLHYFKLKNSQIQAHIVIGDNEQGIKTVAGNPSAIGYVSIGTAEANISLSTPIKLLPLDGVAATSANVASANYPLSRVLNLVTQPKTPALTQAFVDYAHSNKVHDLIHAQHFVATTH